LQSGIVVGLASSPTSNIDYGVRDR